MRYEERDMEAYHQARADEAIWRKAKEHGLSRRRFMELAGLVGGSALLGAACTSDKSKDAKSKTTSTSAPKIDANIVKDIPPSKFEYTESPLGFTAEMKWENMATRGYLTPNDLFYVRQSAPTPRLNEKTWKLTVSGAGVTTPLELTYDQLLALPEVTSVIRLIENSGNGRIFFEEVLGQVPYL